MTNRNRAILQLNIGTFLASFTGLLARVLETPTIWITYFRMLIAAFVIFFFMLWSKEPIKAKSKREFFWMFFLGMVLAFHWIAVFKSFSLSSVAIGITAIFTFPVITALLEPIFLKSTFHFYDILCAFLALLGVYLTTTQFDLKSEHVMGALWGLVAALSFAIRNVMIKKEIHKMNGVKMMLYQTFFGSFFLIPFLSEFPTYHLQLEWKAILVLGVILTALTHTLYVVSMKELSASSTSVISSLQVVYAIFLAFFILGEQISWKGILGSLIIIVVAFYETKKNQIKTKNNNA